MVPAKLVSAAVPVLTDPGAKLFDLVDELFPGESNQVVIHSDIFLSAGSARHEPMLLRGAALVDRTSSI
jgi:hypothetical protein